MQDQHKAKSELMSELAGIQQRIAELEEAESQPRRNHSNHRTTEESQRWLESGVGDVIYARDADGGFTFMSSGCEKLLGIPRDKLMGKSLRDLGAAHQVSESDLERVLTEFETAVRNTEDVVTFGCALKVRDEYRFFEFEERLRYDQDGRLVESWGALREATEQWKVQESLRETERKYRELLDGTVDAMCVTGSDGVIREVNKPAIDMFGYSRNEIVGRDVSNLYADPETRYTVEQEIEETGPVCGRAVELLTSDGSRLDCVLWCSPLHSRDGTMEGHRSVFRDVTESTRTERELRDAEEKLRRAVASIDVGVIMLENRRITFVNDRACEILGRSPRELRELNLLDLAAPEERPRLREIEEEAMITGTVPKTIDFWIDCLNGRRRYIRNRFSDYREHGEVVSRYVVISDVTERHVEKSALKRTAERLEGIVASSADFVWEVDTDWRYTFVRGRTEDVLGYSNDEMIGKVLLDPASESETQSIREHMTDLASSGSRMTDVEISVRSRQGEVVRFALSAAPALDASGTLCGYRGSARDISARGELEATRIRNDTLASALFEATGALVVVLDPQGRIVRFNRAAEEASGYSLDEVEGKHHWDLVPSTKEVERVRAVFGTLHAGIYPVQNECHWMTKTGGRRLVSWSSTVVPDRDGAIRRIMCIGMDITDHESRGEVRDGVPPEILKAQRTEALRKLAGQVAVDFNTLVTAVQGYTDLATLKVSEADAVYRDLRKIRSAASGAADLARQLSLFSLRHPMEFDDLGMNQLLGDAEESLRQLVGSNIEIDMELAADLRRISADGGNIEQVLTNLALNAKDAMPAGGTLSIETKNIDLGDTFPDGTPTRAPGEYVRLSVSDTGVGMDPETRDRAFEPFFSTKSHGEGTGLGLAVVSGIVEQHGGCVSITTEPGAGSTIDIYLPSVPGAGPQPKTDEREALLGLAGNGERILVVGSDDRPRDLASTFLRESGYTVFDANSVEEAIDVFDSEDERFDMVLGDTSLTDGSGVALVHHLLARNPGLGVLMSRGPYEDVAEKQTLDESGYPCLLKPYSLPELLRAVRDSMGSH